MAGFGNKTARVDVYIGGADKAKEEMAKMENEAKSLRDRIKSIRDAMDAFTKSASASSDWRPYEKMKDELDGATKSLRTLTKAINATKADIKTVEDVLGNISGSTLSELKKARTSINQWLNALDPTKQADKIKDLNQKLREVMDEMSHRKETLKEFSDVMNGIGNASDKSLSMVKTRLQDLIASTDQGEQKLVEYRNQLKQIEQEQQKRTSDKAVGVANNLDNSSVSEIQSATKSLEQLRDAQTRGSAAWTEYNKKVEECKEYLERFDKSQQDLTMNNKMSSLGTQSSASLEELKKYWQAQVDGAENGSKALENYRQRLAEVEKEEQNRQSTKAGKVMGDLDNSSVDEIKEAIKITEQLRDAQKLGSAEWEIYAEEIEKANKYLSDFESLQKDMTMDDRMKNLGSLSADALEETRKYWQAQVSGAENGSKALDEYNEKLTKVVQEQQKREGEKAADVFFHLPSSSVSEIQDAIKSFEQLRDAQTRGSAAWIDYGTKANAAKQYLDELNLSDKIDAANNKMKILGTQSQSSLDELKKFWQEQVNNAEYGSKSLDSYRQKLAEVEQEQQKRIITSGTELNNEVQTGSFSGTIKETEDAIKKLKEFRAELDATDTKSIDNVNNSIQILEERLKRVTQTLPNATDLSDAKVESVIKSGTLEELEQLKKSLEEYKKKVQDLGDAKGMDDLNNKIHAVDSAMSRAYMSTDKLNALFKRGLSDASFNELKDAAAALRKELENVSTSEEEYIKKSAELRAVNARIKSITAEWNANDSSILKSLNRLVNYVIVYKGFDMIRQNISGVIQKNLELSDTLGDIRKVTNMSTESVERLSKAIDNIDTRTSQQELHDLAYEAGKLGVSGEDDLLGFVKAGNQLIVALGEELGGAEAVRSLMKVNAVLGETQKLGVEKALLATGSAMNELSNKTRASAGPIADVVTRIGAIGKTANLSMPDLVALAGTADALGQSAEVSGTALNKFISALVSNTSDVGYAVGISEDHLKELINEGNTIQAIIEVLEKVGTQGLDKIVGMMGDLGGEGERVKQVITTLAGGIDELKTQVDMSKRGFAEATSVTNEYNVKNETAQAIVSRFMNMIKEKVVNSTLVHWLTNILQYLTSIPKALERGEWQVQLVVRALETLSVALVVLSASARKASNQFALFIKQLMYAITTTQGFSAAMTKLSVVIKQNPFGMLVTAGYAVYSVFNSLTEKVNTTKNAVSDFQQESARLENELNAVKRAIDSTKEGTDNHRKAIQELNNKYGTYLGFMVTEENYAKNQAYIYKILNARLKENLAIKMKNKTTEATMDKYSDKLRDSYSGASSSLSKLKNVGETNAGTLMNYITEKIKDNTDKAFWVVRGEIEKHIKETYKVAVEPGDGKDWKSNAGPYSDAMSNIMELYNTWKKINNEVKNTSDMFDAIAKSEQKKADKYMTYDLNKNVTPNLNNSKTLDEAKEYLNKYQAALQQRQTELQDLQYKQQLLREDGKDLNDQQKAELAALKTEVGTLSWNIDQAEKRVRKLGGESPYGNSLDLESASVDTLVAKYKALEKEMKRLENGTDYKNTFASRGYSSAKEEYAAKKKEEDEIKRVLKDKYGRNENGNWIKEKNGSKKEEQERKKEIDGALSALDEYFIRRETAIKEARAKEEITEEEMNRQVEKNEMEHLTQRVKLRNSFLNKENQLSDEELARYGMTKKTMIKLSNFLQEKGKTMADGIRKQQAEDLLTIQNNLLKHKKAIEAIILDDNYTEKVNAEYRKSIDALELLFGQFEDRSEQLADLRLTILRGYAKDAYLLDAKGLQERMKLNGAFGEWMKNRTEEDYEALLIILRKYGDDLEEAQNKQANRDKTIADKKWTKSGKKEGADAAISDQEGQVSLVSSLKGLGLASDKQEEDEQMALYKMKLKVSELYLEQLKLETEARIKAAQDAVEAAEFEYNTIKAIREKEGDDAENNAETQMAAADALAKKQQELADMREQARETEAEAQEEVEENRQAKDQAEQDAISRKLEILKGYTDAIVDFGEQMGEAAFGEVEDRKEAAKQLLKTVMQLTKDLIMQKTMELVSTKLLNTQKKTNEQQTQQAITTTTGQQMQAQLAATAGKTTADITAGAGSGAAKTISQLGYWGIPLVAVINAALGALMSLAMSQINKSKEEVAEATGVSSTSRVAAGMLTYAEGDYPVLGNDGQIYNAKYQKELKTGVYGGGAHFGIFSEKKPEMIVDGNTTEKLMLNYPHIYDAILTIAKNGRMKSAAIPTFAAGSYPTQSVSMQDVTAGLNASLDVAAMGNMMTSVANAINALNQRLETPISAYVNPYGDNGAVKQINKASKFMKRRGLN